MNSQSTPPRSRGGWAVVQCLLAAAVVCVSTSGCAESSANATTPSTMAPDFTARDIGGKTLRLSDHLGKDVILLDFWSTYCEPCKAEFPHLNQLYQKAKARGFVVIAVSMDGPETVADVPAFAQRYNLSFPIVLDEDSRIASLYNPKKAAPLAVLIDRTGRVAKVREGYNPGDEDLVEKDVMSVLDSSRSGSGAPN